MITYRTTSRGELINQWKKLILEHRIHFHWGDSGMREVCEDENHPAYVMAMAFDGDTPIGASIIADHVWGCNIMVYVKSKYRRRGIGTSLIRKVKARYPKQEYGFDAYTENYRNSFYRKAGVLS